MLAGALAALPGLSAYPQTADSFNPAPNNLVYATVPMPDGSILVGGQFGAIGGQTHRGLARLFQDGTADSSFTNAPSTGDGTPYINCIAVQTNGQVVLGGTFGGFNTSDWGCRIVRLNPDGTMDTGFDHGYTNWCVGVDSLTLQPDGKIVVGCTVASAAPSNSFLYRLNGDGTLDTSFTALFTAPVSGGISSVGLQPDGKLVVGGTFSTVDSQAITNLVRLNSDGSLDTSFQASAFTGFGLAIDDVLVQPDGKILVGGMFNQINGQAHTNIARLSADGSLDTTFNAQTDSSGCWGVQTLTLQADGRILVGHDALFFDGVRSPMLTRLNSDGTLDPTFSTDLCANGMAYSATLQPDGKILVGGTMGELAGQLRNSLGRLINTESATQSLTCDGTNIIWLRGGASPEVWRTTFETSMVGTNWTYAGDGVRISGGWALSNVVASADAMVRARGFVNGGRLDGSSWFVETLYPKAVPQFITNDGNFGCRTNQFGCSISGSAGSTVEIDDSTNLVDWNPLATNFIYNCPGYLSDPSSTNAPLRFYRLRLQ